MTRPPTDSEIRRMVAELPRPEPPEGFAAGVMARVRAEERRRKLRPWLLAAAAVVLASTVAVVAFRDPAAPVVAESAPVRADDPREELAAIRDEVRSLREAMALMDALRGGPPAGGPESVRRAVFPRSSVSGGAPVVPTVRIGGNDDIGLFLDLESLLDAGVLSGRPSPLSPAVLPASDRGGR